LQVIKETKSICPECLDVVPASRIVDNGKVYLVKSCPEHGLFKDIYWSSYGRYLRANKYARPGVQPPLRHAETKGGCPYDCGLCPSHKNNTILAIIDITSLCNAHCPTCFASADRGKEYVYEPTLKEIDFLLDSIAKDVKALQFTGGEPTLRPDLREIILHAKLRGINHIELNTNGIAFASSKGTMLTKSLENMFGDESPQKGLSTIYLKFNGFSRSTWEATTGDPHWGRIPLQAVENIKKGYNEMRRSPGIVLVPTIINAINNFEVGDIIDYAIKNSYVVRGVNFQPVAFAGSMSTQGLEKERYTIPDLLKDIEEQTKGDIKADDFYPISCVSPFAETLWHWKDRGIPGFACHQHCGAMTALLIEGGNFTPVTKYVNIDRFFDSLSKAAFYFQQGKRIKGRVYVAKAFTAIRLSGMRTLVPLVKNVAGDVDNWSALGQLLLHMVFIGTMHFMDKYNFDLERLQMCAIHQILPDGSRVPFCSYQTIHRPFMERKFGITVEEWRSRRMSEERRLRPTIEETMPTLSRV
jgi:uncharacterized radical SAM superfamily Fe-S cluster-containing enzyme